MTNLSIAIEHLNFKIYVTKSDILVRLCDSQGSQYMFNIGSGAGIVLTAFIFVPLLHPLKLTSMFEVNKNISTSKTMLRYRVHFS